MDRSIAWKKVAALAHVLPSALYASAIFVLSHMSRPPGGGTLPDQLVHFIVYALFTVILVWAFTSGGKNRLTLRRSILVWLVAAAWGALDEFHQSFVPYRDPSWADLLADALGAALGLILIYLWSLFRQTPRKVVSNR